MNTLFCGNQTNSSSILLIICMSMSRSDNRISSSGISAHPLGTDCEYDRDLFAYPLMLCLMLGMLWFMYLFVPASRIRDDNQLASFPILHDMGEQLSRGEYPIMGQYSWHCAGIAGEYGAAVFHPPILVLSKFVYLFPEQLERLGFAWMCYCYTVMLTGFYGLLRSYGKSPLIAAYAGCALGSSGYFWGLTSAWYVILQSFVWVPWYHLCLRQACLAETPRQRWKYICLSGFMLYFLITAGWIFTDFMALILHFVIVIETSRHAQQLWPIRASILAGLSGVTLSAPAWLMLMEYSSWSTRVAHKPTTLDWSFAVNWQEWIQFLVPLFQNKSSSLPVGIFAIGTFPVLIVIWASLARRKLLDRVTRLYLILAVVALILCMMPAISPFRWNFRWLPLLCYCIAFLSAMILGHPRNDFSWLSTTEKWKSRLLFTSISFGIVLLAADLTHLKLIRLGSELWGPLMWWSLTCICYYWLTLNRVSINSKLLMLMLQCVLISGTVATYCFPAWGYQLGSVKDPLSKGLCTNPNWYLVIYSSQNFPTRLSHFHPGNSQSMAGIKVINGYSAMWPIGTTDLFQFELQGGLLDVNGWFTRLHTPHQLLQRMAIDGLIVQDEIDPENELLQEFEHVGEMDHMQVYHRTVDTNSPINGNASDGSSAIVQSHRFIDFCQSLQQVKSRLHALYQTHPLFDLLTPQRDPQFASGYEFDLPRHAEIMSQSPTTLNVEVDTTGNQHPSVLTIARPWLPGYYATWNQAALPVYRADLLMPGVIIPPNQTGILKLCYFPKSLRIGLTFSILTLLIMITTGFIVRGHRQSIAVRHHQS
jgi:hypothetical protein